MRPRILRCIAYTIENYFEHNPIFMGRKKFHERRLAEEDRRLNYLEDKRLGKMEKSRIEGIAKED